MINAEIIHTRMGRFSSKTMATGLGLLALTAVTLYITSASTQPTENALTVGSIAWYVSHISEAKAVNRQCFETKADTDECRNALAALNMAHISRNYLN